MELIVAVYDDWGIGRDGTQPVALSADRKFFRATTRGAMVIAGRRTIEDFPGKQPLPGRVDADHVGPQPSGSQVRRHNDANVLALGAGITGPNLAKRMVEIFLSTEFEGGRHARRVALVDSIRP